MRGVRCRPEVRQTSSIPSWRRSSTPGGAAPATLPIQSCNQLNETVPIQLAQCRFSGLSIYIIFIRINCSFKNKKLQKNKGKRKTHNVSKSTTCQMHTNYARWKGGAENASTGKCKYETAHFARMENACTENASTENASTMQTFSQIKKVWYFTS